MQCCAEIQKCNIDNKAFNEFKNKYDVKKHKGGMNEKDNSGEMNEIMTENAWLNEKMEVLQN